MASRNKRGHAPTIGLGTFEMTERGNSKGLNIGKQMDQHSIPSQVGESYTVKIRPSGPDGVPEVVIQPLSEFNDL